MAEEEVEYNESLSDFVDDENQEVRKFKEQKPYQQRLKRHQDAILCLWAPAGEEGSILVSASADEKIRIWDMKERTISPYINVERPSDNILIQYQSLGQDNLPQFPHAVTNTDETEEIDPNNPLAGLGARKNHCYVTCFAFDNTNVFLAYEDGMITCWDIGTKQFQFPMLGHTNRINALDQAGEYIYSSSNDCTVRQWDTTDGVCTNVFKFADPISVTKVDLKNQFMYTASWDKMIRVIDLEKNIILKAWVASKETIKEMTIAEEELIVAGCDPVIRSYQFEDGKVKLFVGHKGWVYCLNTRLDKLYSGGDDNIVRIWNIQSGDQISQLVGHRNGITQICFTNNEIYTSSFDHYIIVWNQNDLTQRMEEMRMMREEDIASRKQEVYQKLLYGKNKGRK